MPTIWYVREGKRPNVTNEQGIALSHLDFERAFLGSAPQFLSKDAPEFNAAAPATGALRVVVEVRAEEETTLMFPFNGFYLMADMTPDEAREELSEVFATVTRSSRPAPSRPATPKAPAAKPPAAQPAPRSGGLFRFFK